MKWIGRIALAVAGLLVAAALMIFVWSEWLIREDRGVPLVAIAADRSPAGIAEGARLARVLGCLGCHGEGRGDILIDQPLVAVLTSPAFAEVVAGDTDAQLARSIRQGVSGTGAGLWIMPSHVHLADDDTARIMGFLHTLRPSFADLPRRRSFGPLARLGIVTGRFDPNVHLEQPAPARRPADTGRYFATVVCRGCHELNRSSPFHGGHGDETAPALAEMGAAYDDAAFARLLRTGHGMGKPYLGTMSEVAHDSLYALSDDEIAAIKRYLTASAAQAAN